MAKSIKLQAGELAPKDGRVRIQHLQLAVLLANFFLATKASNGVGYENVQKTLEELFAELEKTLPLVSLQIGQLEDLLAAVNLYQEQTRDFQSSRHGESFDGFTHRLFARIRFEGHRLILDKDYNLISIAKEEVSNETSEARI